MTRRGVAFSALFALLLLLALATGSSEIFLAVFLTGLSLLFALVSAAAGALVLRVTSLSHKDSVTRGHLLRLSVSFTGALLLPVIVRSTLVFPGEQTRRYAALLWGVRHPPVSFDSSCPHRGVWAIGLQHMRCGDIFGFFILPLSPGRSPRAALHMTVYPILHELPGLPLCQSVAADDSPAYSVITDYGDSVADTRPYRDGDSLKRIHWKLSMRMRELYTLQYETATECTAVIVIDTGISKEEPRQSVLHYADMATESAAALALSLVSGGYTVRLCPAGAGEHWLNTPSDFPAAHSLLARVPFPSNAPVSDLMDQLLTGPFRFSGFHVIARTPSPDIIEWLARVAAMRCPASLIYADETGQAPACETTPEGVRLIAVSHPRDVVERLGDCI